MNYAENTPEDTTEAPLPETPLSEEPSLSGSSSTNPAPDGPDAGEPEEPQVRITDQQAFPEIDTKAVTVEEPSGEPVDRVAILDEAREALEDEPGVASVSYDHIARAAWRPNDRYFRNGSQRNLSAVAAPSAWNLSRGGVRVGVVDSGCYRGHTDLDRRGKIVAQRDFVGRGDRVANDPYGHGTHIASTLGSETNNQTGVAGMAPNARLICSRVLNYRGMGTTRDVLEGIRHSANNGARVINMSFTFARDQRSLRRHMGWLERNGITAVAGSGNSGDSRRYYPASYRTVIGVGALSKNGATIWGPSTRGAGVNVTAPGSSILAACIGDRFRLCNKSGTSMATPHVSGAAALLRAKGRNVTRTRAAIYRSAVDKGRRGYDPTYGHGRLDAYRAFRY